MALFKGFTSAQRIGLLAAAVFYVVAGSFHFIKTDTYLEVMPSYIPWHLPLVQISGVCEILGGLGLLIPQLRRLAVWGLIALLIAVFPANIYMAITPAIAVKFSISPILLWARLLLQPIFIAWLWWCGKPRDTLPHMPLQ